MPILWAQTPAERIVISNTYSDQKIEQNRQLISEYTKSQQEKIDFLVQNGVSKSKVIDGKTFKLHRVTDDGTPIYISTHNTIAAASTQTQYLHNGGGLNLNLEGQNMIVGIWDDGVALAYHQEFVDNDLTVVTTESSSLNTNSSHATHVLGTMIARGANSNAKGMAPQASAISYDWDNDINEVVYEAANGLLLSNHSYGAPIFYDGSTNVPPSQIGTYTSEAAVWDNIHYSYPYYLQVASAGNDGDTNNIDATQNGFDQLTGEKVAKNNLVVANTKDVNFYPNGFIFTQINPSSSKGPADDGRIKPDITGNGTTLFSSVSDEDDSTKTNLYASYSGTSMAAPNVAGSLLLLQQYHNELNGSFMKSATLKGLVCHTALDQGTPGPDPIFGWGILNSKKAAETLLEDTNKPQIEELRINEGETLTYDFQINNSYDEFAVTVCWTDPAGASNGTLNSLTPALVNDIDITISDGTNEFYPYLLNYNSVDKIWSWAANGDNDVDTVEQIRIANPPSGTYTLTITHEGNLRNDLQDFSLIVTGYDETSSIFPSGPSMTIVAAEVNDGDTSNDNALSMTFTSTDATTDFTETDISVTGGTISNFTSTSPSVYTATFTPITEGETTIKVAENTFTDAEGNNNIATNTFKWIYDATAPTMTITAAEINNGDASADDFLTLTFRCSEPTSDFSASDVSVSGGTLNNFAALNSTVCTAIFTPDGGGTKILEVTNGVFSDAAGNNNTTTTQFIWYYEPITDADGDGVNDDIDLCPDTPSNLEVDNNGCADSQKDTDQDEITDDIDQCPDTPLGDVVDVYGCSVFELPADNFEVIVTSATCFDANDGSIQVVAKDQSFNYQVKLENITYDLNYNTGFTRTFENLSIGNQTVCFTVEGENDYEQCFNVILSQPEALSVVASLANSSRYVDFIVTGASSFIMEHNGSTQKVWDSSIRVPLFKGTNTIRISTDLSCQGVFEQSYFNSEDIMIYPNPASRIVNIMVGGIDEDVNFVVRNLQGISIDRFSRKLKGNREVSIDIGNYANGVYFVEVLSPTVSQTAKIIKNE